MAVRGTIVYRRSPGRVRKGFAKAVKEANKEVVRHWHKKMLPEHFKATALSRYEPYQKRTDRYRKRKVAVKGLRKPLVWEGDLKRNALRQIRVSGTSKRVRGRMPGTQVANFGSRPNMPPMRDEMTAVNEREVEKLSRLHARLDEQRLARIREHRTVHT